MDSNHEWQRQQAQQRLADRRNAAAAERAVREVSGGKGERGWWARLLSALRTRSAGRAASARHAPDSKGAQPTKERV